MAITPDELRKARFKALLAPLYRTPEFAEVEAFLEADPDISDIPMPFDTILMKGFDHLTRSIRKARQAEARQAKQAEQPQDQPPKPETMSLDELIHRVNHGEPYHKEVSRRLLASGWEFQGRTTDRFTPDEDKIFLEDMVELPEEQINEKHRERVKLTARDYARWAKKNKADNIGATSGSA